MAVVDPVGDVGGSEQEEDKADAEDDAEETSAPENNPNRRSQLAVFVLVVVLYLVCQTLVFYFVKNNKFVTGYSDDIKFVHNLTNARTSDLEYMKRFCEQPEVDRDEKKVADTEARFLQVNDSLQRDSYFWSNYLVNVIKKTLTKEDLWCGMTVTYYVCNSNSGLQSYNYKLNFDESITVERCNASSPLSEKTTFVDASLGVDIVIAYSECPDYIRPEKLTFFPDMFAEAMKIVLPVPLLMTLAVYLYLPKLQNLQGKIIICKLLSDLAYSFWPWFFDSEELLEPALLLVCSSVAGITWTSILCYDLWSAFSDCLPTSGRTEKGQRFVYYSLIGWGHPGLFGLGIVLSNLTQYKWFEFLAVVALYVIYLFLNVLNLLLFTFTVKNLKRHDSRNLSLVKRGRQGKTAAGGLNLYFRISALMGIQSFVFENVDICLIIFLTYNNKIYDAVLLGCSFLDNMLYFIILACNKRVLSLLESKWKSKAVN